MVKIQKNNRTFCTDAQSYFVRIIDKINALRMAEGMWREYVGIEPTREVPSPPHRF